MSENAQNSNYNSLQMNMRAQVQNSLTLQVAYTYSKAMDPATGSGGAGDLANVSNPYDRHYDYGPGGLDRTHIFLVNFVYDIPFLKNSQHRMLKSTLGRLAAIRNRHCRNRASVVDYFGRFAGQ